MFYFFNLTNSPFQDDIFSELFACDPAMFTILIRKFVILNDKTSECEIKKYVLLGLHCNRVNKNIHSGNKRRKGTLDIIQAFQTALVGPLTMHAN